MRAGVFLGVAVLAAVAAGLVPDVARAAPVRTLGNSDGPTSALIDAAGTLHVAWETPAAQAPSTVSYCRLATRQMGCAPVLIGGFPSLVKDVHLLQRPQEGVLVLVVNGLDGGQDNVTFALGSSDRGSGWSAPAIVGRGLFNVDHMALTPDGWAVDTLDGGTDAMDWQRVPLGGTEMRQIPLGRGSRVNGDGNLLFLRDGRPMVLGNAAGAGSRFRILRAGADPYVDGSWTRWSRRRLPGVSVDAAGGPRGIFALTHDSALAGLGWRVWRYRGGRFVRFGRPHVLGAAPIGAAARDLAQDAGGRLHGRLGALRHLRKAPLLHPVSAGSAPSLQPGKRVPPAARRPGAPRPHDRSQPRRPRLDRLVGPGARVSRTGDSAQRPVARWALKGRPWTIATRPSSSICSRR